jgi:PST family polysaccharide transporter
MITVVTAATFILGGVTAQHNALLRRQLRFVTLGSIEVVAQVTGAAVAIALALAGAGYWALVAMPAASGLVTAALSFSLSGWLPGLPRRSAGSREMIAFGSNLTGVSLLGYVSKNGDQMLLGYFGGATLLGFYNRAHNLLTLPLSQFLAPMSAATIPVLARLAGAPGEFRAVFRQNAQIVVFLATLSVTATFALAPEMVRFVLGPGWDHVTEIFRIMAPGALIQCTNVCGGWVCTATGKSGRQLRVAAVAAPIYLLGYAVGVHWGATGVAAAFSIVCLSLRVPAVRYLLKDTPIRPREILAMSWKPTVLGVVACALAMVVEWAGMEPGFTSAVGKGISFGVVLLVSHWTGFLSLPVGRIRAKLFASMVR